MEKHVTRDGAVKSRMNVDRAREYKSLINEWCILRLRITHSQNKFWGILNLFNTYLVLFNKFV